MKIGTVHSDNPLPTLIQPDTTTHKDNLLEWIRENHDYVQETLLNSGAILFRGFDIHTPQDFEDVAISIDKNLANEYLGTSPRDQKSNYTFSASELPWYYPIMQHCEMSYLSIPPRRLFFFAHVAPPYGGETPICDFRKVYDQISPEILHEFEQKGVITIRNYAAPGAKQGLNLAQLKSWESLFQTTDRDAIDALCKKYGMEYEWLENDALRVLNRNNAIVKHPITGEKAWFNHLQVFHPAGAPIEYEKIHQRQNRWQSWAMHLFTVTMYNIKNWTTNPWNHSMQVLFGDGTEIPESYVRHVQDVIWENMSIYAWQKGDVIAIDNYSVSHGRLPYSGPRNIMVAWTDEYASNS
jgi:alpha-ketoglutarate-dependent taurine dioxygenase